MVSQATKHGAFVEPSKVTSPPFYSILNKPQKLSVFCHFHYSITSC